MNPSPCEPFADTPGLREAVISTCLEMSRLGYFAGTWGNIGVRLDEGLLVTPTRLSYRDMQPEDLVAVSWEGNRVGGSRLPSSEMHVHRLVLAKRDDIGVVVHSHSPWASAVSCMRKSMPPVIEDMAQIIGGEVRCSRYVRGGLHLELGQAAAEAMQGEATAAFLANHGALVGGRTLEEAVVATQILEKAAQAFVHAEILKATTVIPADCVSAERERYISKYGTADDVASE